MTPEQIMLIVQALDPDASVNYSSYTHQWYVSASVEVGDGMFLTGVTEHRDKAFDAISAFFNRITELSIGEYLVTRYQGHRREWRWNGGAFAECTRAVVFEREAERVVAAS